MWAGVPQITQDDNTPHTEYIPCSEDVRDFIECYCQEKLQTIENNPRLQRFGVTVDEWRAKDRISVTGVGEGLEIALAMVQGLVDEIVIDRFEIVQPGIVTYCAKGKLDSLVRIVNNEEKCYVRVEKKFLHATSTTSGSAATNADPSPTNSTASSAAAVSNSSPKTSTDSPFVVVTPQGHQVSWKVGDIATEQAHTLVSPQGVCAKAIFAAAGPNISKIYQAPQTGEITITPGYLLACSHVIHTCCCKWQGGQGEETLRGIVRKSLSKVTEIGGDSVAFPVIGTGNLAFPSQEASRILLDEAVAFCKANPLSPLKDIRFVLFHGDQGVIDAFQREGNSLKEKYRKVVEVVQGDLTQQATDAIVNIIGTDMNMANAGELCKVVARASGAQVENECRNLGRQPAGSAVITSGGDLAAPHIIHMVVGSTEKQHLQLYMEKCIQQAETKGLKTISLPAVGTGAGGVADVDSARATFQALRNTFGSCVNLRQVRIVLYRSNLMQAFLNEKKLMEQQDKKQPASNTANEPPRKKIKTEQDAQPDCRNKNKVVIHVIGSSKAAVKTAIDTLKQEITEAFTRQTINQQIIRELSRKQISDLRKYAKARDVKLEIHSATSRIVVHGEHSLVAEMVGEIWRRLNDTSEQKRAAERAKLPTVAIPKNWDRMPRNQAGNDVTVHMVKLPSTSSEYKDVERKFYQTVVNVPIVSIERIQNPHLYQAYQLRKQKMDKDNGGSHNELQLFHGTSSDNVAKINTQGFNRSFSGTANGTALGKGVYFARDALYSVKYAVVPGAVVGSRCMYLARVLVGQYCQGNQSTLVPPPRDPSKPEVLFDSVVNDVVNPGIFVVFFDNQCYPEYLIKF